jgi:ABC-type Fe3+-hydroxamate transport system substrate-binding protein
MGRVRRLALAAALGIATLALLTGCGERSEPTGKTAPLYPVTIEQGNGSPLVLEQRPQLVVATTPAAAELLSAIEGKDVSPSTSTTGADLVVTTPEGEHVVATAPVYTAAVNSIHDVERSLTELGLLLDRPLLARGLVDRIESKRTLVRTRLGPAKPVTVFVDTGFFITPPAQSLVGDLVRQAGGKDVAGAHPPAGPFDVRTLRRLDPDYYIATSESGVTYHDLRHDPRTRRLRAVKLHHFAIVPSRLVQPSPEIGSGLLAIARVLHPDAFR